MQYKSAIWNRRCAVLLQGSSYSLNNRLLLHLSIITLEVCKCISFAVLKCMALTLVFTRDHVEVCKFGRLLIAMHYHLNGMLTWLRNTIKDVS